MNPGTFYLYEYENSKRTRNVGFIKTSRHYRSCILQIHARGIPVGNGASMELRAFFRGEDDVLLSEQIAVLNCFGHNISTRLSVSESRFPEGRPLAQIDGFLIKLPGNAPSLFWMASDLFFDADIRKLKTISTMQNEKPADSSAVQNEKPVDSSAVQNEKPADSSAVQNEKPVDSSAVQNEKPADSSAVQSEKPAGSSDMQNSHPAETAAAETDISASTNARKIRRSEMSQLPRKFWPLANNSFLLHGYHNYGHLLLIEEDSRLWLGVPGTYAPQEARAADLFGFPRFTRSYAGLPELTAEERADDEDFGHWCRCVGNVSCTGNPSPR